MKRKKVAFLVVSLNAGGIENYLLRFLAYYQKEIDATVYCKSGKIGDLENEYENIDVRVKRFSIGYFDPIPFLKLKLEFKNERYDSVADFTGNFAGLPLLMAKQANIPKRIALYRNADDKFKKTAIRVAYNKWINRIVQNASTNLLSNSKTALNHFFRGIDWERNPKFEVVYNGIDASKFLNNKSHLRQELNIPADAFVVGNVSRFNEQKNHMTAMKVAVKMCQSDPNIYFVFSGKGVDTAYQKYVDQLGLSRQIKLLGYRKDVINVVNTLDCFYFPSILEGQPNALIEAMIANLPFVASNIDPVKETIPANLIPYLLEPYDVDIAIANILKIKNDRAYREKFQVSDWAVANFNPDLLFKRFYDKL